MARALADDLGLALLDEGRAQAHIGIAVECGLLHCVEGAGEAGAAVRINEVVATMHGGRHGLIALRCRDAKADRQHDRIAVWHDGDLHRVFGVMPIGHVDIIGQGGA